MNKQRRGQIEQAIDLISLTRSIIEDTLGEEQEAFDNLTEGLQQTERGQHMEECIAAMEEALSSLEEVEGSLEEVSEGEPLPKKANPTKDLGI